MKNFVIAAVSSALLLIAGQGVAVAADVGAGKKKAAEVCAACHGPDGNSPTSAFPNIAGQHASYLEKTLNDYKSGARKDPIMAGMVAPLSKQDIENLAAYFSGQSGLKTKY